MEYAPGLMLSNPPETFFRSFRARVISRLHVTAGRARMTAGRTEKLERVYSYFDEFDGAAVLNRVRGCPPMDLFGKR